MTTANSRTPEDVAKGEVRAITLMNRAMNVTMKGTYGYVKKSLRDGGFAMLTATSQVREFVVDMFTDVDLPHFGTQPCFIGTDYYGRKLELPISRILNYELIDTPEQGSLRGLNHVLGEFDSAAKKVEDTPENNMTLDAIQDAFKTLREKQAELIAAGVTEYVPLRASEEEL